MEIKLTRELIGAINTIAKDNLDRAQGMIDMVNAMFKKNFFFINRRVSYETKDHGVRTFHDAYVWICVDVE